MEENAPPFELPLFPLQSVLFPGGLLGLKVFEVRYLDLVGRCLREQRSFGVVALTKGGEVRNGGDEVAFESVGCAAEVMEVDSAQPGILMVRCRGTRRFETLTVEQQADGLWVSRAHWLPDDEHVPPGEAPDSRRALIDAIELERELVAGLRALSTVVDTSSLRPVQLRLWVRQIVQAPPGSLTLVFESFAFKFGVPLDADFVFDVRVLPNPHYIPELKALTGRDLTVIEYLEQQPEVGEMLGQIEAFLARWLPSFEQDQRAYLTVAIGCTGGQHRSVYFAEQLARRFAGRAATLVRHREQDARA
jgi:RNase adaptor protein for sRNA GlmZ degradation